MPESVHDQNAAWLGGRSHCSEYQKRHAPQNYARPRHAKTAQFELRSAATGRGVADGA
jgi:hypothetical protein